MNINNEKRVENKTKNHKKDALLLEKILFYFKISPVAIIIFTLCFPGHMFVSELRKPISGGEIYINTKPPGAHVFLKTVDISGKSLLPVGKSPGPIHLSRKQFPCTLLFKLWGYKEETVFIKSSDMFESGNCKSSSIFSLTPKYPVIIHFIYFVKNVPFLFIALLCVIIYIIKYNKRMAGLKREKALELRIELGDFSEGVPIGDYRLGQMIGAGGMARVFEANRKSDAKGGERLALKILSGRYSHDSEFYRRFEREVNICRSLVHPNIVPLLDWGDVSGYLYLVMELIEGESLALIMRKGKINRALAVRWVRETADALCYAHKNGIVHRDVKPGNIMITQNHIVKLMDFGIARREDLPVLTQEGQALGTPAYAPPEQIKGYIVDWRADYYSLGVMFYEMLAGRHPFMGATSIELLQKHLEVTPEPIETVCPDIPEELKEIVNRMISKEPDARAKMVDEIPEKMKLVEAHHFRA